MSLIHWWPLNGNTKDLGLNPISLINNGATVNSAGKIGQTYRYNGGVMVANNNDLSSSTTNLTIAGWVYLNSGNYAYVFSCRQGTGGPGLFISLETTHSIFDDGTRWTTNYSIPLNTWVHFAFTRDASGKKLYINGTLHSQTSTLGNLGSIHNKMYIGRNYYNDTASTSSDVMINDLRIYDHALSAKEIKELSKGLVLHYNFEDEYIEPTTNLAAGIAGHDYISKDVDTYATAIKGRTQYENKVYTFRVYIKNTSAHPLSVRVSPFNATDTDYSAFWGNVIAAGEEGYSSVTVDLTDTTKWNGKAYLYIQNRNPGSIPESKTFYIKEVQFEQKDHATPFVNGTRQPGLIYDNSGYGYNGTPYGNTLQIVGDSRIGNKCAKFDNTANSAIVCGNGMFVKDELTVNWWGYMSSWSSYGTAISCTEGGGWNFEPNPSKMMRFPVYLSGIGYKSAVSTTTLANLSSGWHMFTGTYDGYTVKIYIDGVLEGSISSGASSKTAIGYPNNGLFIGSEAAGTATTPTSPYFNGNMADVKIYSTALSAEDVKAEYNRKAAIDKDGNLFTGEFVEGATKASILKNNTITSPNFAEIMTLEDGSCWVPISVHYVPDGLNTSKSKTSCYTSEHIWNNFGAINTYARPEDEYYEFYVLHQENIDSTFDWYRFKQTVNPLTATWAEVNPSNVGTTVIRVGSNKSSSNGAGMYWMNSGSAMCFANSQSSNTFGCGCIAYWHGADKDIPSYNNRSVKGWQLVYMRITNSKAKILKSGVISVNTLIEK